MPTEQPSIEQRLDSFFQPEDERQVEESPETEIEDSIEESPEETEAVETEDDESYEESPEADTEEEESFQSITELAEALEMPVEEFKGQIKIKVKAAGKEHELTLADLEKGYQFEADYRQKTAQTAEERRQLEAQRQELQAQYANRLQEAGVIVTQLEQGLLADYQDVNWAQLRAEDENEYLIKRQDYNDRVQMIENVKSQARAKAQELQQEQHEQLEAEKEKYIREQGQRLLEKLPDWNDGEKANAEWGSIQNYLITEGFSPEDVGNMLDHRAIIIARKAMLYDKGMQNVDVTKKKVKKLPKITKPGARQAKSATKGKQISAQRQRLKKTGDVRDAAKLLEQLL